MTRPIYQTKILSTWINSLNLLHSLLRLTPIFSGINPAFSGTDCHRPGFFRLERSTF